MVKYKLTSPIKNATWIYGLKLIQGYFDNFHMQNKGILKMETLLS